MTHKNTSIHEAVAAIGAYTSDQLKALQQAIHYYSRKLFSRHFNHTAASTYGYTPLTPKYKKEKQKKYGKKPILVASGNFKRKSTSSARVIRKGNEISIQMTVPIYALYQLEAGRDWQALSKRDVRDITRKYNFFLKKIRSKKVRKIK